MQYVKDVAILVGCGLLFAAWSLMVLAGAALPVVVVWYLLTH